MINNDCSDNEYNHDIIDEDIISESNEIESSDIGEQSDTNNYENSKNGEIRCNNNVL